MAVKKVLEMSSVRQTLNPYLPPPVLQAMDRIDPLLQDYVGPDATISITATLFLAWIVLLLVRFFSSRLFGSGKAIDDEENEQLQRPKSDQEATVLFCGPTNAGKTRLFYQICCQEPNLPTVQSIRANVGTRQGIRYVDWPGHGAIDDAILQPVLGSPGLRVVLVLDATQPAAGAADCLYQLLVHAKTSKQTLTIFVACHKKDVHGSKNPKRVKIQIRTELERILKVHNNDADANIWPAGEPIELEELPFVKLHFCATDCTTSTSTGTTTPPPPCDLVNFCNTGNFPKE
jgi:signal recognition particle receptor subunit beta